MLDGYARNLIDPPLNAMGRLLARGGVGADVVTLAGLLVGLASAGLVALGHFAGALTLMLASRLLDGLDGAVARATRNTDFGGYFDIVADFLFYGVFAASFVIHDPGGNGVAGTLLLAAFYFNGATFLGYAILAERHGHTTTARGHKTLYFTGGLLEGTETIAFFVVLCLWPGAYAWLSAIFAALCFVTAGARVFLARATFHA